MHHARKIWLAFTLCASLISLPLLAGDESSPQRLYGVLQMSDERAEEERRAGLQVAVFSVGWDRYQPAEETINRSYVEELVARKAALRKLGYRLMLDFGVQYPPDWIFALTNSRYKNQFGQVFQTKSLGENLPNVVFNAEVRTKMAAYFQDVFRSLGTDWDYVRIGCAKFGELNFPSHRYDRQTNCYWAFDDLAQGKSPGLPAGMPPCPVPGWIPGSASPNHQSARRFADWYLESLKNYQDWQISTIRESYAGDLCILYGTWGIRPGQLETAIEGELSGSSSTEINGEIQQGYDWSRMIGGITDPRVIVYCTWLDGTLQNRALGDDDSDDVTRWSPVHWQASLARSNRLQLRIWGENTGRNNLETMQRTFKKIQRWNVMGMLWAFESDLFAHPNPHNYATFADYRNCIHSKP